MPRITRRRYLSGLSLASGLALAGCTSSSSGTDGSAGTDTGTLADTKADQTTSDGGDGSQTPSSPTEVVRAYLEASPEDAGSIRPSFHPLHPFHPGNMAANRVSQYLKTEGTQISDIELERQSRTVTPATVLTDPLLQATDVEQSAVTSALDGGQTAVVESAVTLANGVQVEYTTVAVTSDGNWKILATDVQTKSTETSLDAYVVDEVTFYPDENRARVQFVDDPVADSVTVEASTAYSARSSDTPDAIDYFDVTLDPNGDELIVTATVDGSSRVVHRQQYPASARIVDEITYTDDPEHDIYEASARVDFTGNQTGDRLVVESTVQGSSMEYEPASSASYAVLGVDPDGDEIVVRLTTDGTTDVVYREQHTF